MPYVTERWSGGMLTNFPTVRKAIKKMATIDKMATDGTFTNMSKRERLQVSRQRAKLEKLLGSIKDLTRLPAALFIVDVSKEYIAVNEARKLNIPVFGMVDTNSDPSLIDFVIPANDDASKSIHLITDLMCQAIEQGLNERKVEKDNEAEQKQKKSEAKAEAKAAAKAEKTSARKSAAKKEDAGDKPVDKKPADKPAEKPAEESAE